MAGIPRRRCTTRGDGILLPDGKRIYPPRLRGQPIKELAVALLDMDDGAVDVPATDRPARRGQSQIARALAHRLWTGRDHEVIDRHRARFYRFVELQPGPSSDEFFFRYAAIAQSAVRLPESARSL